MKTLAEYLKSAEAGTWLPEQTAFVLRHVEQVEATYRQLLSSKADSKSYVDKSGVQCGQPDTCKACSSKLTFLGPAQNNLLCCPNEACSLFRNRVLWLIPSYLP